MDFNPCMKCSPALQPTVSHSTQPVRLWCHTINVKYFAFFFLLSLSTKIEKRKWIRSLYGRIYNVLRSYITEVHFFIIRSCGVAFKLRDITFLLYDTFLTGMTATMSSEISDYEAANALSTDYNTIARTTQSNNPWLELQLGQEYLVSSVFVIPTHCKYAAVIFFLVFGSIKTKLYGELHKALSAFDNIKFEG